MLLLEWTAAPCFNPRAPEGARRNMGVARMALTEFQSTRPRRGATPSSVQPQPILTCFNPRAPEGARLCVRLDGSQGIHVSIHAPPKGRDCMEFEELHVIIEFQSTRPRRGATGEADVAGRTQVVSIHAPPEGRDVIILIFILIIIRFNPRAPGGARLDAVCGNVIHDWFQSTRPRRGAMWPKVGRRMMTTCFNPRAPGGARSNQIVNAHRHRVSFNPRAPGGARY